MSETMRKRKKKQVLFRLPVDQIKLLDNISQMIGFSRNDTLILLIDQFSDDFINFARGWAGAWRFMEKFIEEMEEEEEEVEEEVE